MLTKHSQPDADRVPRCVIDPLSAYAWVGHYFMQISSWQRPYYHNLVDLYNGDRIDSFKLYRVATDINLFCYVADLVLNFLMQFFYM